MKREPTGQTFRITLFDCFISAVFFVAVYAAILSLAATQGRPAEFIKSFSR